MAPKLLKPLVRLLLLLAGLLEVSAQGATARDVKPEVSLHTKDSQGGGCAVHAAWRGGGEVTEPAWNRGKKAADVDKFIK